MAGVPQEQMTTRTSVGIIALGLWKWQVSGKTIPEPGADIEKNNCGRYGKYESFPEDAHLTQPMTITPMELRCLYANDSRSLRGFDMLSTLSTACSSAANALIMGADMIRTGRTSLAVCGWR